MEINELATKLYLLCCDMDKNDYIETSENDIKEIETAIGFIASYNKDVEIAQALKTFCKCLVTIASTI